MQQIRAIAFDPKIRLGQGGYSSVFAGTWKNQEIAVKRVESIDTEDKEEKALRQLTHENVVKLLDVESDNSFK
jgi:serine/threonine protein kinase